ncbi:MAG TPA: VWA domain-containing protein [Bryobacteraceae bacterium]|jgi:VWFA-related protein|nr:VWA domain-containing protein [Bryobacteraceae bacterium]
MPRSTIALLLCGLLTVSAQQPPAPAAGDAKKDLVISTTTQLVVEDVLIKGKDGKPVLGLKPSDFTLTEDGKPQKISVFEFQTLEEGPSNAAPVSTPPAPDVAAAKPPEKSTVKPVTTIQITPETPGNLKYRNRRLMVMFFDMTSMPIQDQKRAQNAALKFLRTQITPADMVAIMTFSSDVKVMEDFTDDRDQLEKDIKSLVIGEGQGFEIDNQDDSASDTGAAFQQDDTEFNIFNTDRQLSALETAVKMLASLNEKKSLVYFASGIQRNGLDNQAQLRSTINAAIRANVSFYPIDARGLVAQAPLGDATKGSPGGQGMYSGSSARAVTSNFQNQQETLYTLAADTGGKALLDNNDLSMGIVQAQKDMTSYYIIGYYTTNEALDGRFRRIKITVNNSAVARTISKLDYRQGYYGGKTFKKFNESDKEQQLAQALALGDPITDMDIAMEMDYFRLGRDRYFVPMVVKIPGSEIELARHGGAESTRFDFIGEIKDAKGATVGNVRDNIEVKLKGESAQQLAKTTLEYDTGFTLPPGSYTAKFLARENETGKMGTYEAKFVVPDLTSEQKYLPISSVVLSNQREKLDAAVASAEKDKKLLAAHPLIQDGMKLIPSVTRVFRKDQNLYVYLEAYEPAADATQPLMANVSFYRGKVKAFETDPLQVSDGLNAKTKAVPLRFSVPLAKLQAGRYTCQVSVLDPSAQKFAFWRARIVVLP